MATHTSPSSPNSFFTLTPLNGSTYRVVEDDKHGEYPFIYVICIAPSAWLVVDTGCGSGEDGDGGVDGLKRFLERELAGEREARFVVVLTHCHFDHIGAIEQFTHPPSEIYASSRTPSFTSPTALPASSLCTTLDLPAPSYTATLLTDFSHLRFPISASSTTATAAASAAAKNEAIDLLILHTPGHTPDSLSLYDAQERTLYTGDLAYEWVPIIFPALGGCVSEYLASVERLLALVRGWNAEGAAEGRVLLAAGHVSAGVDAEELLGEVRGFLGEVLGGKVLGRDVGGLEGEQWLFERGDGRVGFKGGRAVWEEAGLRWCGDGWVGCA